MSTILERLEYGFDRDSRRTWRKRTLTTGEDNAYTYDGLSQVVNAARGNLNLNATAVGGVPAETQAWDYDPTGNWRGFETKANGSVALDQSRVHDKGNRLTQIEGAPNPVLLDRAGRMREVSPDASGNWNESQQVKWDAWSRVVRIESGGTTSNYAYDGLTRRTTQSVGGTTTHTYYSDAWRPLEERRGSQNVPARQYCWGARHRDDLVRQDRATTSGGSLNETRYVLMDYFSPAAITDGAGVVKERYAFSAFGVRRILTPTFGDRATSECDFTFAFQGQFLDAESGFLNYGYRYYSPHLGRWLNKDPIEEEGETNLYKLENNNSVNAVDILGLITEDVWTHPEWNEGKPTRSRYGSISYNQSFTHDCVLRERFLFKKNCYDLTFTVKYNPIVTIQFADHPAWKLGPNSGPSNPYLPMADPVARKEYERGSDYSTRWQSTWNHELRHHEIALQTIREIVIYLREKERRICSFNDCNTAGKRAIEEAERMWQAGKARSDALD
jgi:RHS repeat-associated protein